MASEQELRDAFNTCDLDGKGTISAKELGAVLKALGEDESIAAVSVHIFSYILLQQLLHGCCDRIHSQSFHATYAMYQCR